jgi:hypothetical protein
MESSSGFEHEPFSDANSQIRLLQFLGRDLDNNLPLFALRHYQLSERANDQANDHSSIEQAPRYIAMSYTWGSPDKTHEVVIKAKSLRVGANCYYALSQAVELEAYPAQDQLYWMDQICINQQDMVEKGKQVGNMGEVYRRASTVFACVGPHADDSEFLFDTINDLDMEKFESLPKTAPCISRQELIHQLLEEKGHPDKNFERTRSALAKLAIRPYWTRLWILQEIFLSVATAVLCGGDFVSLPYLASFWDAAKYYDIKETWHSSRAPPETIQQVLVSGKIAKSDGMSLPDALKLCVGLGCVDRRDSVYGIRAMVRWPADLEPPDPDYTISTANLYIKMMPYLSKESFSMGSHKTQFPDLYMLIDIFNLNKDDARLKARARALASHRLLYKALNGVNMDGPTVRDVLQQWVDFDNSQVELPPAELIHAWQTALQPRPKGQKLNEFAEQWNIDPRAHIMDEEESYAWRGGPSEEASKRFALSRLTGLRSG